MGLAEVSRFPSAYLSVAEVIEQWEVSVRTLRRRLAAGAPGAYQDKTGQWILSAQWVDSEFHRRKSGASGNLDPEAPGGAVSGMSHEETIDLTDHAVERGAPSDAWITELVQAEHRATKAETHLELAEAQIDELRAELQSAKGDLDYERALVNRLKDQLRGNPPA